MYGISRGARRAGGFNSMRHRHRRQRFCDGANEKRFESIVAKASSIAEKSRVVVIRAGGETAAAAAAAATATATIARRWQGGSRVTANGGGGGGGGGGDTPATLYNLWNVTGNSRSVENLGK
ncbi:hypothetical protein V1478_010867, partial [Vespula squamosa]